MCLADLHDQFYLNVMVLTTGGGPSQAELCPDGGPQTASRECSQAEL